jgi:hypothetical protein
MPPFHPRPPLAPTRYQPPRHDPSAETVLRVCPECAGPLIRASGCVSCRHCGWGRCG